MDIKAKLITLTPTDSLKPNPRNTNRHSTEQLNRLAKIIEYQGFRDPIIVSNKSGYVVCGHARLDVAKKLNMELVPVIHEDFDSLEQEFAHMTADNEIARWAELDYQLVYTEMEKSDFDKDLLGIEDFKVPKELLEKLEPEKKEKDQKSCPNCGELLS